jgi:hypothetical protein
MSSHAVSIKSPRSPIIDLFLSCITFSVFLFVWLYQAVRDLNRIREQGFQAWLWIFVPLFVLPAFFALPILLRGIKQCEQSLGLSSWSRSQEITWLILVWSLSVGSVGIEYADVSILQQFVFFGFWLASYFLIAPRINRLRAASDLPKTKLLVNFSLVEWITTVIFVPVFAAALWFSGLSTYFVSLEKLEANRLIQNTQYGFSLQFVDDSWHQVEIGTHSNGEAIAEFTGHQSEASLIVFEQEDRDNVSRLIHWRIDEARESLSDVQCTESRSFMPDTLYLRIHLRCEGYSIGDPALQVHELIQVNENDYIEVYGSYSAIENKFEKDSILFLQTVQSFAPIAKEE